MNAHEYTQDEWPLLVIVPASLRLAWAEEFEKWLPEVRPAHIHVIEGHADRVTPDALPSIVVTSYDMMQRLTCDVCKNHHVKRGGRGGGVCEGPAKCMAAMGFKVSVSGGGVYVLECMCGSVMVAILVLTTPITNTHHPTKHHYYTITTP